MKALKSGLNWKSQAANSEFWRIECDRMVLMDDKPKKNKNKIGRQTYKEYGITFSNLRYKRNIF